MTLDNMTGITKGSYTGVDMFCKSQLITCNRVKACNGVCPFEDALKHADKEMNEQTVIDHDRDWIIGCIKHDGFIKTDRFDKANQIILEALSADAVHGEWEHWGSPFSDESEVIDTIVCSVCGARFIEPKGEPKGEYNYCPNCGTKMDGERREP